MKTALLIMDMKESILKMFTNREVILQKTSIAFEAARKNNIPVIYIRPDLEKEHRR